MINVKIYGKDNCIFCERAKELLTTFGYSYDYLKYGKDFDINDIKEITGRDKPTVPQIIIHDKLIGGYTELIEYLENTSGGYGEYFG